MSQRRILTLNEKHEAIKKMESGKSARAVAKEMGVGKTQITQISKRKAEILCDIENNVPGKRKRKRHKTGNEEINDLCSSWFQEAMTHKINVIGPLLKEQALKFASDLKIETFKASNGWLSSFVNRHNIVFGKMSGERGDVDDAVVSDWLIKLPSICEGYEPKDIFNMDETGFFYQ